MSESFSTQSFPFSTNIFLNYHFVALFFRIRREIHLLLQRDEEVFLVAIAQSPSRACGI